MNIKPSDRRVKDLVAAIADDELNLQPDFQRDEVWGLGKKRLLIDSILRDWYVPPIHVYVIDEEAEAEEVLDGQQRLAAIRDFAVGKIKVDGGTHPKDDEIESLHNLRYDQLPPKFRNRFDRFAFRVFQLEDFTAEEPGELFFRLNQNATLTPAEQRNAFIGRTRSQVKGLVARLGTHGVTPSFLGYSNKRLSYDAVVATLCLTLENGTLSEKVTAYTLAEKYRRPDGFSDSVVERASECFQMLGAVGSDANVRFNKATTLSWLLFLDGVRGQCLDSSGYQWLIGFLEAFEKSRTDVRTSGDAASPSSWEMELGGLLPGLLFVFNDRASSRVADASSVQIRDLILWYFAWMLDPARLGDSMFGKHASDLHEVLSRFSAGEAGSGDLDQSLSVEAALLEFVETTGWRAL